ncbi:MULTISPECIES: PucR family transcriptional regulator [Clostridium]|uniref:PucR family transcriptional regulator n=1 Tax=Clostridium disporicum TaxID=84024 RepID=A0A174JQJ7_9CLOT|nr:helix-turn-helix domain-containing protein [Clostridium disporicum]MCD2501756.1 helix-turn-helix domain-containing protein [Clostridium sp. NSJ-145]CUO99309.1 PucR family transcriptional regulator [Clostridium disporicum]
MKFIEKLVDDIYKSSKIPFNLNIDGFGIYSTPLFDKSQNYLTKNFKFENTKCCIKVNAAFSAILDLLIFCIKDKLEDGFLHKRDIILSLLKGEEIEPEILKATLPALTKEFYLVSIYAENNIESIYDYIKECYTDSEVEVVIYKGNIIIIGELEDARDHMESIKETIDNTFSGKYYISYSKVLDLNKINKEFEDNIAKIELAKKYNFNESIIDDRNMIFEGIIDSVSDYVKEDVFEKVNNGFLKLDTEMIKTIEVFFKCGLNLSDAAKELYIHRNTLIYRLDKIEKYTSYDIREFNNAVIFKLVFFLWKEKKTKNS